MLMYLMLCVMVQCDSVYWHCQLRMTCSVKLTIACSAMTYNCTKINASWDETSALFLEIKPGAKWYIYGDSVITECCFSAFHKRDQCLNNSTKHRILEKKCISCDNLVK